MSEHAARGSSDRIAEQPATVTAALTQVLAGTELVAAPECGGCRRSILPGQSVTAYAYRDEHEAYWHVPRVYCSACERTRLDQPTDGWAEALVTATLEARGATSRLDPDAVIAWAGPESSTHRNG